MEITKQYIFTFKCIYKFYNVCDFNIKSIFGVILQTVVLICSTVGYVSTTKSNKKIKQLKILNEDVKYEALQNKSHL